MGRSYAGVLGPLAFATVLVRGMARDGGIQGTIWQAVIGLFAFAIVGAVLGQLAGWIVDDSVRARLAAEMAAGAQAAAAASGAKTKTPAPVGANPATPKTS